MLDTSKIIVSSVWALAAAVFALMSQGDIQNLSLLLAFASLSLTSINWYDHRGGRSPSFLFLAMACVFLCGRAFPALFGGESQLALIGFGDEIDASTDTVAHYAELVLASLFLVHIGSLLPRPAIVALSTSRLDAKIYLMFFLLTIPLYLYKNVYYFEYIMSHGGYLAIYQGTEFIEGVGLPARVGALLCLAAFTLYFFHETNRRKARWSLILFVAVFSSELLVGLRGKFFIVTLVFLLFYKLRFGGKFSIRGLLTLLALILALAIVIEIVRQGGTTIEGSLFMGFLVQQGVTAGVNLIVLENFQHFAHNAWSYFFHQFLAPFYAQQEVQQGWFLANDISMMVMPTAYALGFGSGSSYLAELLLLGGVAAVGIGSFVIGWLMSVLTRFHQGIGGAILFWVVCGLVYYPRTMLQDPVHNLMRYAGPILLVVVCGWLVKKMMRRGRR